VTKRRSDVPVFLLFAGIIHAIGLALLLPMLITLPGPEGESAPAPEIPSVDVIVLPPPQPLTDVGPEETSALPSASRGDEGNATGEAVPVAAEPEPGQEPRDGAVAPDAKDQAEAAPQETKPPEAEPPEAEPSEGEPSQAEPLAAATPERDGAEAIPEPKSAVANVTPAVEPRAETVPQPTEHSEAELRARLPS
jgi:hypothetical protein